MNGIEERYRRGSLGKLQSLWNFGNRKGSKNCQSSLSPGLLHYGFTAKFIEI